MGILLLIVEDLWSLALVISATTVAMNAQDHHHQNVSLALKDTTYKEE